MFVLVMIGQRFPKIYDIIIQVGVKMRMCKFLPYGVFFKNRHSFSFISYSICPLNMSKDIYFVCSGYEFFCNV